MLVSAFKVITYAIGIIRYAVRIMNDLIEWSVVSGKLVSGTVVTGYYIFATF